MSSNVMPSPMRKAGGGGVRVSGESFVCPDDVLEIVVEGLAGCDGTLLSETVCGGILDPNEVIAWVGHLVYR